MQVETKLEIQQAAQRLVPVLVKVNVIAAILCILASFAVVGAVVMVAASDDSYIHGVTDSGEVHTIPLK